VRVVFLLSLIPPLFFFFFVFFREREERKVGGLLISFSLSFPPSPLDPRPCLLLSFFPPDGRRQGKKRGPVLFLFRPPILSPPFYSPPFLRGE